MPTPEPPTPEPRARKQARPQRPVPEPRPDSGPDTDPKPSRIGLTFFITPEERTGVLRVLRRYGPVRSLALLDALGVDRDPDRDNNTP